MSDPTKPQFLSPELLQAPRRHTRVGHGAPLHHVASERKTKVGVAPAPKRQPPAVPPEAKQRPAARAETAAPVLLIRRKDDDAFSSRVTNKLPDARLVPAAARAAFAGTWGVTLQGPPDPRTTSATVTVATEPPRGVRAWFAALVERARRALWRG